MKKNPIHRIGPRAPIKILTVVEEDLSRFLLKSALRSIGYEVEEAVSGEEAWSKTKRSGARLVIADLKLPDLDGLELCRRIQAEAEDHIYFLLLTEEELSDDHQTRAYEAGIDDFLAKPVAPRELRNRLRIAERVLDYSVKVSQLESFLPICGLCDRVRNDDEYWSRVESYLAKSSKRKAAREICPDCAARASATTKKEASRSATTEVSPTGERPRPTLAMIASRLQVSTATVSMALRNSPRISKQTRARVEAVAAELGYTPNPEIGKVMHHLRTRRRPGFQSVIVALTTFPNRNEPLYVSQLIEAMQARAAETGYGFTTIRIKTENPSLDQLQRVLLNRGTEGIVTLPMTTPLDCSNWLDWSGYSAVAASHGILSPTLDRVVPNWYESALIALGKLHEMGCERIGAIFNSLFDQATCHQLTAALNWHAARRGLPPIPTFIYTASFDALNAVGSHFPASGAEQASPSERERASVEHWLSRARPDALLCDSPYTVLAVSEFLKLPGGANPPKIVTLNRYPDFAFPGVEEHPAKVASTIIDQLAQKIKTGEKGPPTISTVTKILGHWVDPSLQRK